MQVSVENVGSLERKLTVRIPAGEFDTRVNSRLAEMSRSTRLKGFRPGKVPVKVIEQRFGAQIRGETMSELVRTSFQQAVDEQKLRPAVAPSISTSGRPVDGEIEYTATFEVLPDVGKIDVGTLAISKPVANVAEADVDTMIETLRQQRRTWAPVERAASRIAPATRADALAKMESIAMSGLKIAGQAFGHTRHRHSRTLSILGNYGK